MKPQITALLSLTFAALAIFRLDAVDFQNGDFSQLLGNWEGAATIGYLNSDGTITPDDGSGATSGSDPSTVDPNTAKDKKPVLQLDLSPVRAHSVLQRFSAPDSGNLDVEVEFKGSDDLKRSTKAFLYSSARVPTVKSGAFKAGKKSESGLPNNDLSVWVGSRDKLFVEADDYKTGGDWQTIKVHCSGFTAGKEIVLYLFAAPGAGKIFVRSVKAS